MAEKDTFLDQPLLEEDGEVTADEVQVTAEMTVDPDVRSALDESDDDEEEYEGSQEGEEVAEEESEEEDETDGPSDEGVDDAGEDVLSEDEEREIAERFLAKYGYDAATIERAAANRDQYRPRPEPTTPVNTASKAPEHPMPDPPEGYDDLDWNDRAERAIIEKYQRAVARWEAEEVLIEREQAAREAQQKAYEAQREQTHRAIDNYEHQVAQHLSSQKLLNDEQRERVLAVTMQKVRTRVLREGKEMPFTEANGIVAALIQKEIGSAAPKGPVKPKLDPKRAAKKIASRAARGESANGARAVTGRREPDLENATSEELWQIARRVKAK